MNDLDKLRVMLPHWIDHNQGHGGEFAQWSERLTNDSPEIAELLHKAVSSLQEAQSCLEDALNKTGGPLEAPGGQKSGHDGHEHTHKHNHDHDCEHEHKHG